MIPKGLPNSSTSKETVGVAEVSSCSACHSNSGISKTTITAVLKPLSEQVVISEIRCAVYVVYHYHSLCSSGGMAALFQEVFPDKCSCRSRVLSIFGKTFIYDQPWFSSLFQSCNLEWIDTQIAAIWNELTPKYPKLPVKFVSAFDESFRVSTTKQIDVRIIYFDETTNRVKRVCLNSQFMGHATMSDMMKDFKKAHNGFDIISNLVQLSIDGPNVN